MESSTGSNELLRLDVISKTKEISSMKARHQKELHHLQAEMAQLRQLLELQAMNSPQGPLLNEPTQMEVILLMF